MTERLYYTDARLSTFSATVVALEEDGRHVVLDQTAFYPTSGGQLHDMGQLDSVPVIDVIDEETRIVHVCAEPVPFAVGDVVPGTIDGVRRFDHMQQHSGQHLLSALLTDGYGWPTVSVHFGDETNTVDVAAAAIAPAALIEIESQLNRMAAANHAITVSFEEASTATGLRKPSDRDGVLRIVTIEGIDRGACGGTHCDRTGEIGSILLRRVEKTKGNTRIEFVCGLRAVQRARLDATLLSTAARMFTAAPEDVPALLDAQQRRVTTLERERKQFVAELAGHDARARWNAAVIDAGGVRSILIDAYDGPVKDAEPLVQAIVAMGPCVVLVLSPSTSGAMLGAGELSGVDAGKALREALQTIGGRGGGSPKLAQGGAPDAAQLKMLIPLLLTVQPLS